jgi:eukaryotic-like serine/threonine-protein kinase
MAAPSTFIQSGGMLGRYRILEQIGVGGMGVVYRARDERLERDVAIKLLAPGTVRSSVARHRVRNEALALSRISHPNIETIFEFDSLEQWDFLVVELIAGISLDELLAQGPLSRGEGINLCTQLLRGLAAAHEKGIIHRDLKPSNLRLSSDGFLKVLDFGLAQFEDSDGTLPDFTTETHTTLFAGTLAYMSPEQVRGLALSPRSDLYSVGVVLYQMMAGRLPFLASGATLIDAILNHSAPPPTSINKSVGGDLQRVILKAMEKDPNRRYQSAREMLADVEAVASGAAQLARRLKTRMQIGITAAVLLAAVFAGAMERDRISSWLDRQLHPVPQNRYVAVLPFRSSLNDPAFDQGLTDAVATKLMEITAAQAIQVVSPHELFAEHITTPEDARRKLGVNLVIEGTLQEDGKKTRVNLDLLDAVSGRALRAANFDANSSDAFAIQDQVFQRAVQMLEIEIHKNIGERGHGTTNSEAFKLYTRGLGFLQNSVEEDVQSAIAQFQLALALDPGYAEANASLGSAYLQLYRITKNSDLIKKSREACDKASQLRGRLPSASVCNGQVDLQTGDYQHAASDFQIALENDPGDDEAYRGLGSAYEALGRTPEAEETYKKAVAARPQYAVEYSRLGNFYAHQTRYADAAREYELASSLAPRNPRTWSTLGGIYLYGGEYEKAIETIQRGIRLRPSFDAYSNLGLSYFALRRFPEAIAAFEQAVQLGPRQIQAHGNLARAYYWYLPKRTLAKQEFLRALAIAQEDLKINPNDADVHELAAQYFSMVDDRNHALEHLNIALKLRPNDAETLYVAAIVDSQIGNTQGAIAWLKQAIRHGYSPSEIATSIELDTLRKDSRVKILLSKTTYK